MCTVAEFDAIEKFFSIGQYIKLLKRCFHREDITVVTFVVFVC